MLDSQFKRPRDKELPESSKRQRLEGDTTGGVASGPAGRRETRFRPLPDLQTSSSMPQDQSHQAEYDVKELEKRINIIYDKYKHISFKSQEKERQKFFLAKKMKHFFGLIDQSCLKLSRDKRMEQIMQDIQNIAYNGIDELDNDTLISIKRGINTVVEQYKGLKYDEWG